MKIDDYFVKDFVANGGLLGFSEKLADLFSLSESDRKESKPRHINPQMLNREFKTLRFMFLFDFVLSDFPGMRITASKVFDYDSNYEKEMETILDFVTAHKCFLFVTADAIIDDGTSICFFDIKFETFASKQPFSKVAAWLIEHNEFFNEN